MASSTKSSEHVGQVGETMRRELHLYFRMDTSNDEFDQWLHKLHDEWGNILVWFGGKELSYADTQDELGRKVEVGESIDAEFHIKSHTVYEGEKQTLVVKLRQWQDEATRKAMRTIRRERRQKFLKESGVCPDCAGEGRRGQRICKTCEGGW